MTDKDITIREALATDAPFIALVVCMALDSDATHPLYEIFEKLAARDDAQYSYRNTLIAEVDGKPVAAIVGYDGALLHKLREPLHTMMRETLGRTIEIEEETSAGEFYADSLAVLPEYRGRGIGSKLLNTICERAFANNFKRVGLLVDFENPKAGALYSSLGFVRINAITFLGHRMWHLQRENHSTPKN